jgi:hypothetical protein
VGSAYQKGVSKGLWAGVSGPPSAWNAAGQDALDEILTNPGTVREPISGGNFNGGYYYVSPNGTGAAFGPSGQFVYFGSFRYP